MCRADIEARDGSYTYFNHNSKYLTRAETDELLLEPLLNGNEIMEYTSLPPGPAVGTIREALLKAQVAGRGHRPRFRHRFRQELCGKAEVVRFRLMIG